MTFGVSIIVSAVGHNGAGREKRCLEQPLGFVTDIYILEILFATLADF